MYNVRFRVWHLAARRHILPGAAFIFISRTFEPVCDTGSQRSVLRTADHIYTAINNLPEDMLKRAESTSDFQITSPTVRRSERNRTVQHVSAVCTNKWENETCASKSVTVTLRIQWGKHRLFIDYSKENLKIHVVWGRSPSGVQGQSSWRGSGEIKNSKKISGRGHSPSSDLSLGEGNTPAPHPTLLGASPHINVSATDKACLSQRTSGYLERNV